MTANKRIPVSEELWEELGEMKQAGQTYDDLLKELIQRANRDKLADRMDDTRARDEDELVELEDV